MTFMERFSLFYLVGLNTMWFHVWMLENQTTNKRLKNIEDKLYNLTGLKNPH